MLNLVIFGPPGAGKGTQAKFLIKTFDLIHISTGELLRKEIAEGTRLGIEAKLLLDKGELAPDDVVVNIIKNELEVYKDANGFIFDGFPRTVEQAKSLDELLNGMGTSVSAMINLQVGKEELVNRILKRGKTSGRTDDRNETVIRNRINIYNQKTVPLIKYYEDQEKCICAEGMGTVEEIADSLIDSVKKLAVKK